MNSEYKKILEKLDQQRFKLAQIPSPIEFRKDISAELGFSFFIKRDDILGIYGGNKVRKLEFLFKDAIRRSKKLFVFGPTGSHHIIANLIYGKDIFDGITSVVFPTFLYKVGDTYVRENFKIVKRLSKRVIFTPNYLIAFVIAYLLSVVQRGFLVPPGSTSPRSSLGFVLASFEIKDAVESGQIPEPDFIFLPAGTCGTLAGLSLGNLICGLSSKVVGVRVVEKIMCNWYIVRKLIKLTFTQIRELSPSISKLPDDINFVLLDGFIGKGYGYPTEGGQRALEFFARFGIKAEKTYTAKTLSAILELKQKLRNKNVLFYYTLNTIENLRF